MAVLIGMSGGVRGRNFEIDRDEISIGRTDDNAIVVNDPAVSGRHCSVLRTPQGFILRDHGSTNGTRLNLREVKESRLKPKDLIRVGSTELMFDGEAVGDEEASEGGQTEVEVAPGPAAAPESFHSISPFGARSGERSMGWWWYVIIALVGALALAAVVVLFINLIQDS